MPSTTSRYIVSYFLSSVLIKFHWFVHYFPVIFEYFPTCSIIFYSFPTISPIFSLPDRWTGARPAVPAAPAQTIHPSPPPSRRLRPSHVRSRPHPPRCFEPEIHQLWSLWSWAGSIGVSWKGGAHRLYSTSYSFNIPEYKENYSEPSNLKVSNKLFWSFFWLRAPGSAYWQVADTIKW